MARRHCQLCADGGPPTETGAVVGVLPLFGALLLGAGVALLVVLPRGNQPLASRNPQPAAIRPVGAPAPQPLSPLGSSPDPQLLLSQLAEADRQWTPRAEPLVNGGYRYVYKRRAGEPPLKLETIRALIANPPSFERERQAIGQLLQALQQVGVQVNLSAPQKSGAAAEWDPRARTVRIQPIVVSKGTLEFARVLNHEAIHVAQSCSNQGLGSDPLLLGLPSQLPGHLSTVLDEPIYRTAPERVRQLEREAFANQDRLTLGVQLVQAHC